MTAAWASLYLPSDDANGLASTIQSALAKLDYDLYDPFNDFTPGTIYAQTVKLFVAPSACGWTRVLLAPDSGDFAPVIRAFAHPMTVLDVRLAGSESTIRAYDPSNEADLVAALTPYLRPDRTPDDLRRALLQTVETGNDRADESLPPLDALPDDVREMASTLNPRQVNKLFGKMMRQVNRMVGGEQAAAARALIDAGPQWDSEGGRRIRALMACLTIPDGWHTPDFVTLRDAYQLHHRQRNQPDAPLYPGDDAAMAQVPNALDTTPIYAGKVEN